MPYKATVLADSVNTHGERLVTVEAIYPRMVHGEVMTHRVLSRNSASSRATPVKKMLWLALSDPFIPDEFGRYQRGMEPDEERPLTPREYAEAAKIWQEGRDFAVQTGLKLLLGERAFSGYASRTLGQPYSKRAKSARFSDLCTLVQGLPDMNNDDQVKHVIGVPIDGLLAVHKQYINRVIEPTMWHTNIISATDWDNFFALRINPKAQREIKLAATAIRDAMADSRPTVLHDGQWHLPFFNPHSEEDAPYINDVEQAKLMSVFRCAGVSYLTHGRKTPKRDIARAIQLMGNGHMSPFEHVARPMTEKERSVSLYSGNFRGWHQFRKDIPNEHNFSLAA